MNTQRIQNCTQMTAICLINAYIDTLIENYRRYRDLVQEARERKQLYREFKNLSAPSLRDIGMDDPQQQLKTLGRYL